MEATSWGDAKHVRIVIQHPAQSAIDLRKEEDDPASLNNTQSSLIALVMRTCYNAFEEHTRDSGHIPATCFWLSRRSPIMALAKSEQYITPAAPASIWLCPHELLDLEGAR